MMSNRPQIYTTQKEIEGIAKEYRDKRLQELQDRRKPCAAVQYATKQITRNGPRYCLKCHRLKKRKYWLFGKRVCKNPECSLRDGYVHPFAPQDRGESLAKMERYPHSGKPCPKNMSKILHADMDTIEAYDAVETDCMNDLMQNDEWVKKYKIKD